MSTTLNIMGCRSFNAVFINPEQIDNFFRALTYKLIGKQN